MIMFSVKEDRSFQQNSDGEEVWSTVEVHSTKCKLNMLGLSSGNTQ